MWFRVVLGALIGGVATSLFGRTFESGLVGGALGGVLYSVVMDRKASK